MRIVKGINSSNVKVSNQSAIRKMIYHAGPISRLEISEQLGLTLPTITTNVNILISKGLVQAVEPPIPDTKPLGRKTSLLEIIPNSKFFLGIELRGSLRRLCITDYRGNILRSIQDDTFYPNYDENIAATCTLAKKLVRSSRVGKGKLAGIGVGIPGLVDTTNGVLKAHPGYGWSNKEIARDVLALTGFELPISVENNACSRAYGAYMFSIPPVDVHSFAYMYVSQGIACPFMNTGAGFQESIIGTGEVGHMIMNPEGPLCTCGNRGCLEAYSSVRTILGKAAEAVQQKQAPVLCELVANVEAPTMKEVLQAQQLGDPVIRKILEDAILYLGIAIANIDNFIRPDCTLIECPLFQSPENRELLLSIVQKNLYTATSMDVRFLFVDDDEFSGAKGAAAVAIRRDMDTYIE